MNKFQIPRRTILAAAPMLVAAPYVVRAQGSKPEKTKVVLAVGGKSALYYLSVTIAETKGFFKDAGLDVEINDFQGGAKSLQALMGGSADVVAGAYEHTIRMQQRGQPIVGFALIGRQLQPLASDLGVGLGALAVGDQNPHLQLRHRVTLLGSLAEPGQCLPEILVHALTHKRHDAQVELG